MSEVLCHDYGDAIGCNGTPDPRYTMRFDDLGKPPIHWCSHCGPIAQAMTAVLVRAIEERRDEVEAAIIAAEAENRAGAS